jgi:uncharacterized membrane-anchored protein
MIKLSPTSWLAIAVVALVQTVALASMVYGRVSLLRDGREIVAEVIPVDPRDIFRGDYVILGYGFTRSEVPAPEGTNQGDTIYVTLKPGAAEGQWDVAGLSLQHTEPADPTHVVLKGLVSYVTGAGGSEPLKASVRYGIESYFVPEGTGIELEKQVRDKKISAVLAVGKSGEVAIKALVIDGKRLAEQPLL